MKKEKAKNRKLVEFGIARSLNGLVPPKMKKDEDCA